MAAPTRVLAEGVWSSPRMACFSACGTPKAFRLRSKQAEGKSGRWISRIARIWYAVAAVIIVLIIIGYATGWFGGEPAVVPQQ